MHNHPIKRALLSVADKSGIVEFATQLNLLNIEIISTGGTSALLKAAHIPHRQVDEITGLPAMLDGRVKTLHPTIHGGILGKRGAHDAEIAEHHIPWIDLVVVNFYPFSQAVHSADMSFEEAIELIDIGGPTMVRAAAKNFAWVSVVVDPIDYAGLIETLRESSTLTKEKRQRLAEKAFATTAEYDAMIYRYFSKKNKVTEPLQILNQLHHEPLALRYGENPHQEAFAYLAEDKNQGVLGATQHQGKALSYNNIVDADAAWQCLQELNEPGCVIVKHANPCGVGIGETIEEAFQRAYSADSQSAFGGIVALNRMCTSTMADKLSTIFMEVIIAPQFSQEALAIFAKKPNCRLLAITDQAMDNWEIKSVRGGVLVQQKDEQKMVADNLQCMTIQKPTPDEIAALLFAWSIVKHIKSNAILIANAKQTVGVGAGQVSRIEAVRIALNKAGDQTIGSVLASDAFFPFRDSIDLLANKGIRAIIQPGGSKRDDEVIAACNEYGIALVFTGKRCFKH